MVSFAGLSQQPHFRSCGICLNLYPHDEIANIFIFYSAWYCSIHALVVRNTISCYTIIFFRTSCSSICMSQLSGLSQATCADFGINFTLADSSYCSADDYNTRSHECCECVSLARPITSQPQTTELVRVSRHSFVGVFPKNCFSDCM